MFEEVAIDDLVECLGWLHLSFCLLSNAYDFLFDGSRHPPVETQRVNWMRHKKRIITRGHFRRMYRMNPDAFDKLVQILDKTLKPNSTKAFNRSPAGPIITEVRLHCLLRFLAGDSYLDICALVNIPHSSFYQILWQTCNAVSQAPELELNFPTTPKQLRDASAGFESISSQEIMSGCIGVIDGWLCPIEVPPSTVVGNVRSYFSGHYQRYGLNIQAVTDHLGRFIFMAVAAPGSQGDINALARTSLPAILDTLQFGYFIIGDNAYGPSEHLVPVFGGTDRLDIDNDNANFYLSQCRIRVEMAFSMMTQRFGLLKRPLRISPLNIGKLMQTIARLHNYCLTQNNDYQEMSHGREQGNRSEEVGTETNGEAPTPTPGVSYIRESLVCRVKEAGLCRVKL
jgi:hypothetical protein